MRSRAVAASWSSGASPGAMIEAFGEEALEVAVLQALLEEPERRLRVANALGLSAPRDPLLTR